MKKTIFSVLLLTLCLTGRAQTAEEQREYEAMLKNSSEESARLYYEHFPNSPYREDAYIAWQTRMLQSAKQLPFDQAINKLNQFKVLFPNSPMLNQARSLYELRWSEGLAQSQKNYDAAVRDRKANTARISRNFWRTAIWTPVVFGVGYGLGYATSSEPLVADKKKMGFTMGGLMGGVWFVVPLTSLSIKSGRYKREVEKHKAMVRQYSTQPVY